MKERDTEKCPSNTRLNRISIKKWANQSLHGHILILYNEILSSNTPLLSRKSLRGPGVCYLHALKQLKESIETFQKLLSELITPLSGTTDQDVPVNTNLVSSTGSQGRTNMQLENCQITNRSAFTFAFYCYQSETEIMTMIHIVHIMYKLMYKPIHKCKNCNCELLHLPFHKVTYELLYKFYSLYI